MKISRLHMSITLLVALALHGGIVMWFAPSARPPLSEPPAQPLRVSLLATVAETTVSPPEVIPEPPPKPVSAPKPKPKPRPKPEPAVQEALPSKPVPPPEQPPPDDPPAAGNSHEPGPLVEPVPEVALSSPPKTDAAPLDAEARARYEQLLVSWLEKHKKYPRRARRLRIEGEGMLRILIDRGGRTLHVSLEQRTGNRLLDKAALDMARRADPFPPLPDNHPRNELEFVVPVAFVLR